VGYRHENTILIYNENTVWYNIAVGALFKRRENKQTINDSDFLTKVSL